MRLGHLRGAALQQRDWAIPHFPTDGSPWLTLTAMRHEGRFLWKTCGPSSPITAAPCDTRVQRPFWIDERMDGQAARPPLSLQLLCGRG